MGGSGKGPKGPNSGERAARDTGLSPVSWGPEQKQRNREETNCPDPVTVRSSSVPALFKHDECSRIFLTPFEDLLRAHSYPINHYVDALLTSCSKDDVDWCRAEIREVQWVHAKKLFVEHFAGGDMLERFKENLETIAKGEFKGLR